MSIKKVDMPLYAARTFAYYAILRFIAKFPLNTKSWTQATHELPELHLWMTEEYNKQSPKEPHKFPEGRSKTPSQFNRRHRKGIENLLNKMHDVQIDKTYKQFEHWFTT